MQSLRVHEVLETDLILFTRVQKSSFGSKNSHFQTHFFAIDKQ